MMSGDELVARIMALPPEQRKLPVVYEHWAYGDEHEGYKKLELSSVEVKTWQWGGQVEEAIRLSDEVDQSLPRT